MILSMQNWFSSTYEVMIILPQDQLTPPIYPEVEHHWLDVTFSNTIYDKACIQFTPVVLLGTHSLHAFLTSQT